LEEHLEMHRRWPGPADAVLGYTALSSECNQDPFMRYVTHVGRQLFSYGAIEHGDVLDFTYFWGGRTSCKREFLLAHGVFNPAFQFGCEDIELGFRLAHRGLRVIHSRLARSTMVRSIDIEGFCERLVKQGRSNAHFSRL